MRARQCGGGAVLEAIRDGEITGRRTVVLGATSPENDVAGHLAALIFAINSWLFWFPHRDDSAWQAEDKHATIGRSRLVIAQVNPELLWTHGDTAIEPGLIDVLVPAAVPPMELVARPAGPIDRARRPRRPPDREDHGRGADPEL